MWSLFGRAGVSLLGITPILFLALFTHSTAAAAPPADGEGLVGQIWFGQTWTILIMAALLAGLMSTILLIRTFRQAQKAAAISAANSAALSAAAEHLAQVSRVALRETGGPRPANWHYYPREVDPTGSQLLAVDPRMCAIKISNPSASDAWIAVGGLKPVIGGGVGCDLLPASGQMYWEAPAASALPVGAVSAISEKPITLSVWFATTGEDQNILAEADAVLERMPGIKAFPVEYRTAFRDLYKTLSGLHLVRNAAGLYVPSLSIDASLVNLAEDNAGIAYGGVQLAAKNGGVVFNGIDGYVDTKLRLHNSDKFEPGSCAMFVLPGSESQQASRTFALSSGSCKVGPNRAAGTIAVASIGPSSELSGATPGRMTGWSRDNPNFFLALQSEALSVTIPSTVSTAVKARTVYIGADHGAGGARHFYRGTIRAAYFGRPVTLATLNAAEVALNRFQAEIAEL